MEEVIILLLQFFFEVFFNVILNVVLEAWLPDETWGKTKLQYVLWFILGCAIGAGSLFILHHTFIPLPALRIANLFLSPLVAAYVAEAFSKQHAAEETGVNPKLHFWIVFWLTLGFVCVRFAYISDHHYVKFVLISQ